MIKSLNKQLIMLLAALNLVACQTDHLDNTLVNAPGEFEQIRNEIIQLVEDGNTPTFAVAVIRDKEVIWKETFRQGDDSTKVLTMADATFPLASLTKSMSATLVMRLAEKGLLSLDDPVVNYLPEEFENCASRNTTLKELLNMTGGIPHGWISFEPGTDVSMLSNEHFLEDYGISVFPEGIYEYSNYAFGIVEAILERATDQSYTALMREELFNPLGMDQSYVPAGPVSAGGKKSSQQPSPHPATFYPGGAAGVHSTLSNMIRYAQFHLGNSKSSYLKPSSLHQLHYDKIYPTTLTSLGWGSIALNDTLTWLISNGSFRESANSNLTIIPSEGIGVICLADRDYQSSADVMAVRIADVLVPGFADAAFSRIEAHETARQGELDLARAEYSAWEGFIRIREQEKPLEIVHRGDSLFVSCGNSDWQAVRGVHMDQQSLIFGYTSLPVDNPLTGETVLCKGEIKLFFSDQMMQGYFSADFREKDEYNLRLPFYIEVSGKKSPNG